MMKRLEDGLQERRQNFDDCPELARCIVQPVAIQESVPLSLSCSIMCKVWRENDRRDRHSRVPPLKGGGYRFGQHRFFEGKAHGQQPDILEIFHAAIDLAQGNHRLHFFGGGASGCPRVFNVSKTSREAFVSVFAMPRATRSRLSMSSRVERQN